MFRIGHEAAFSTASLFGLKVWGGLRGEFSLVMWATWICHVVGVEGEGALF